MLLLAVDTATAATSVAVVADAEVLAERTHVDARGHAEVLAPLVREVLADCAVAMRSLAAVAVGVGPGAYTGLRVGLVTAQALGSALDVPVHGVVTLDALAAGSGLAGRFAVVTDARRREVFWALYDGPRSRARGPEAAAPDVVAVEVADLPVVGAGGTPFADRFADVRGPDLPSAGALGLVAAAELGSGAPPVPPVPLYLRPPDVAASRGPRPVTPR
ncbi:MAG: tRNA (adenosine(37)-N6)-threonylcarbamoyltransferase complex dimerization subunit type 1 TsaB [Actinomycetota bacterium]|nr:tRNA (adenosine(37)-N6)-threonylcarbamoyltransferase complex dimerization subunit type 1 TsaB [Actinomycetota bacterium]MDH5278820.1 tRNA (adenosine(37)-N6)-threonylcarbamoyltransferase complex dimerization subunit type 1 TsaB [Actinomycetota bacterium]